jgi:methionyl aminopeptidase
MIHIKSEEEIKIMREAGKRLAAVMAELKEFPEAGMPTLEIDFLAKKLIEEQGCRPAFLGYKPHGAARAYPFTTCISINSTVVHGLPSDYVLKNGDLLKIDLGLVYEKYYSDMAITLPVGDVSSEAKKLIAVTEEALYLGIKAAEAGKHLGDIGFAIHSRVKTAGFSIVDSLTGHGVGKNLHEDPYVFNFGKPGDGERLVPGMVLALEPMTAAGGRAVRQFADDSFVTADKSLSAHFEHTILIADDGPEILTR